MFESITTIDDYIKKSIEWNMPAVCVTNHGNVASWYSNKKKVEKSGLRYLHAMEAYITMDNSETEKRTADNAHTVLIARNEEGAMEINRLSSNSYNRKDNHYYYKPRIFFDELIETSDNIIILSACLGSGLNQARVNKDEEKLKKWLNFFVSNKHRVYLEVQAHNNQEQKEYNSFLLGLAEKHGMSIVGTNDVHNLDNERNMIAKAVKESKGIIFDSDDEFDTTFKSRAEMFEMFVNQGVLSNEQINMALDNTIKIVDSVEYFEVNTDIRYPHIFNKEKQLVGKTDLSKLREKRFESSLDVFKHLILLGYKDRGIHNKPEHEQVKYKRQVNHELETYIKTDSIDYMLLEYSLKKEAREYMVNPDKSIRPGYGRGSVAGSLIAYLLRVTEIDSVKEDLYFERFMSPDRVGVPDIDSDWLSVDKESVVDYLINRDDLNCAQIYTKGVSRIKSSVKAVGKSMGYQASEMNGLCKIIEANNEEAPESIRSNYPELFEKVDMIMGSVSNFGRHAGGVLVSSENIKEIIGLQTLGDDNRWVTQLDMDEISELSLVKLDVLGVDNVGLVNETLIASGLPYLTPDSSDIVDFEDEKVWESIRLDNTGIFQFESDRAGKILKDILSPENVKKVKDVNPNIRMIDLMSLANASQRPSGLSFVEQVTNGEMNDNGHEALDEFLSDTNQFLVYQEQQSKFLIEFAGFDKTEADTVRKGISKKKPEIMNREVPKIKPQFIKTMVEKYGDNEEHANQIADAFITIFMDSVDYGFNKSHSIAYSFIGYISGWLRYYYPLEFLATGLNIWQKKPKEVEFLSYADKHNIEIMPPRFGKSKGNYVGNKEDGKIYQGTAHIKGGNASVGDALYTLKDYQYKTFTDLIIDVIENARVIRFDKEDKSEMFDMTIQDFYRTHSEDRVKEFDKLIKANPNFITYDNSPLSINRTKIEGLIKLNFFEEFGQNKKLQQVYDYVMANYNPKNKTFANKQKKYLACLEYEASLEDERFSILEQCEFELFYTGRVTTKSETIPAKYAFVTKIENVGKTRTTADVFIINKGISTQIKVGSKLYKNVTFEVGDLIEVLEKEVKPKEGYVGGVWTKSPTERELWIKQMKMIRRSKMTDGKKEKK